MGPKNAIFVAANAVVFFVVVLRQCWGISVGAHTGIHSFPASARCRSAGLSGPRGGCSACPGLIRAPWAALAGLAAPDRGTGTARLAAPPTKVIGGKAAALVPLLLAPPLPGWVVRFWKALPAMHSHGWAVVTVRGHFGELQLTGFLPPQLLHTLYVPAIMSGRGIFPRIPEKVLPIPRYF